MRRIGVIGTGKMGEALLTGLIKSGFDRGLIKASDISEKRRRIISERLKLECYEDNPKLVEECDVVVLAVPPSDAPTVLRGVRDKLTLNHLVISIAAGVPTRRLFAEVGGSFKLIRAMPNNPCLVCEGMTVLAPTPLVTGEDMEEAKTLFSSIGRVAIASEEHIDAVTGLSGSGPAYVYLVIEALADGGVKMGLPKGLSLTLAAQTVLGAARMVLETGRHPAELKDMVATPGGTTVQGLYVLEEFGVRVAFMKAVEQATKRATELADLKPDKKREGHSTTKA